jgi:hypothetical protein
MTAPVGGPTVPPLKSIGLDPSPCDYSSEQANWNRLPQILSAVCNCDPNTINYNTLINNLTTNTTFINNLTTNTTFINNITNNATFISNLNTIVNNYLSSSFTSQTWLTNVQYDTGTHKFQYKTVSAKVYQPQSESAWTDWYTTGQQIMVTSVRYATHKIQYYYATCYVMENHADQGPTDVLTAVNVGNVVNDVEWDSDTSHALTQDYTGAVYVFEAGSVTTGSVIDTAVSATCS